MLKNRTASWIATGTISFACVMGLGGCEPPQQPVRTTPTTPAPTTPPVERDPVEMRERAPITEPMDRDVLRPTDPGMTNGLETPGTQAQQEDARLNEQIRNRLQAQPELAQNVTFTVEQGRVTLRGQVQSQQERESAQRIAEEIAGPGRVLNQIQVQQQDQIQQQIQDLQEQPDLQPQQQDLEQQPMQ